MDGGLGSLYATTIALGVVCTEALVALRALGRGRGRARGMRVCARLPLVLRRSLYLVEVGERYLLLGVGDGPTTLLTELDRAAAEQMIAPPMEKRDPSGPLSWREA